MDIYKAHLRQAFLKQFDDLGAKLEGLSSYDMRRPLVPTGTNLLGLVKHVGSITLGYLGGVFDRPADIELPWFAPDSEDDADLWVTAEESNEQIFELYAAARALAASTIDALELDSPGFVPWWPPESAKVTLEQILVHVIAETARHTGQADIIRELIDGQAGRWQGDPSLTENTPEQWATHRTRVEQAARDA
ncbi:MAG: DinB family protein [Propionibacteriaceae bacterium]|jgi:uncharacterized damage-inducible protein DinB|nr:DinB family protein [Propionibacteriaceae bacterium]